MSSVSSLEREDQAFIRLDERARAGGFLDPQPWFYFKTIVLVVVMLALPLTVVKLTGVVWAASLSGVWFALATSMVEVLGHDIGHRQLLRGRKANAVASFIVGPLLLGSSSHWWNAKHNQHHRKPNHLGEDPDVEYPLLIFAPEQLEKRARWLRPIIRHQFLVIFFLMPLQALNSRVSSFRYLLGSKRPKSWPLQLAGIGAHLGLYLLFLLWLSWGEALGFALVHLLTLGVINVYLFAPNHKGMPVVREGEERSYLWRQVATARNFWVPAWMDQFLGGLNFQAVHHGFTMMPRNKLREFEPIMMEECAQVGIPYTKVHFFPAVGQAFGSLRAVTNQLKRAT